VTDTVDSLAGPPERCVRVRFQDPKAAAGQRQKRRERKDKRWGGTSGRGGARGGEIDPEKYFAAYKDPENEGEGGGGAGGGQQNGKGGGMGGSEYFRRQKFDLRGKQGAEAPLPASTKNVLQ